MTGRVEEAVSALERGRPLCESDLVLLAVVVTSTEELLGNFPSAFSRPHTPARPNQAAKVP